jgi:hypothetical protein
MQERPRHWPHWLSRGSAAVRLLRMWVRIPKWAWLSVYCESYVLSGRVFCVGLIIRPEESAYRVLLVWVWSWILDNEDALAHQDFLRNGGKKIIHANLYFSHFRDSFIQNFSVRFVTSRLRNRRRNEFRQGTLNFLVASTLSCYMKIFFYGGSPSVSSALQLHWGKIIAGTKFSPANTKSIQRQK